MSKEVYCILMDASSGPGSLACRTVYGDLESAMSDLTEIRKTGLYPEAAVVPMRMVGRDNLPPSARGIMMGSRFNPDYMLGNYGTAEIGGQTWTARNLMAPNSPVHGVFFSHETAETYFTYEAAVAEAFKYPGWHIPTVSDWEELIEFCGGAAEAGRKLKAKRGWGCDANGGTDQYRFGAAPAGYWDGEFRLAGRDDHFWVSGGRDAGHTSYVKMDSGTGARLYSFAGSSRLAYSLRLVRDRF